MAEIAIIAPIREVFSSSEEAARNAASRLFPVDVIGGQYQGGQPELSAPYVVIDVDQQQTASRGGRHQP